jgi:hypothetical protein
MIPYPLYLELAQPPRPQTSHERELAALAARAACRTPRPPLLERLALRRLSRTLAVTDGAVTIRHATTDDDRSALARIALLEGRPLPGGPALVAQVDDRIVAGLPLATDEPLADPFRARRDVVQLLRVRAAQLPAA